MGLMGLFSRSPEQMLKKHGARVTNRRAQNPDRWESIRVLSQMRTEAAVEALLGRFTIRVDPTITDQEERDLAFHGILEAGEVAIELVKRFMGTADSIDWPLKILTELLPEAEVNDALLEVLGSMSTDYERDPHKKIQLVATFEERHDSRVVEAVTPFLDDVNETVRFHSVGAIVAQQERDQAKDALLEAFAKEESVRVRARIADAFIDHGWEVSDVEAVKTRLPTGYSIDAKAHLHRR